MDPHDPHKQDKQGEQPQPIPQTEAQTTAEAVSQTADKAQEQKVDYRAQIAAMSDEEVAALYKTAEQATFYLQALQRANADFDNYQKRVEKERDSTYKYAIQNIVKELLRMADIFAFAIQSATTQAKDKDYQNFYEGMRIVHEELLKVFRQFGVQPIEAKNRKFDVRYHEAIRQVESADHPDMTVIEELEKGYLLHDRLLRASKVVVSRKPQPKAEPDTKPDKAPAS